MYKRNRTQANQEQSIIMVQQEPPVSSLNFGSDFGGGFNDGDPRAIWLTQEIYPENVPNIIQQILSINYEDTLKEKEAKLNDQIYIRHPIKLYISSYGGSVYDGLGLIGVISSSRTPVHTYAVGKVMSMGLLLAISGAKRFAYPHTTYMFHSLSTEAQGTFTALQESAEEAQRLQHKLDHIVLTTTNISLDRLTEVHRTKLDWYFDVNHALELKCVDEII